MMPGRLGQDEPPAGFVDLPDGFVRLVDDGLDVQRQLLGQPVIARALADVGEQFPVRIVQRGEAPDGLLPPPRRVRLTGQAGERLELPDAPFDVRVRQFLDQVPLKTKNEG